MSGQYHTGEIYAATPYLRRLTPANGWHAQLVRDRNGQPCAITAVRVGRTFTDAVAFEAEDRCVATRYRTHADRLIVPGDLPGEAGAVWHRDGACVDVLAELLDELPPPV